MIFGNLVMSHNIRSTLGPVLISDTSGAICIQNNKHKQPIIKKNIVANLESKHDHNHTKKICKMQS